MVMEMRVECNLMAEVVAEGPCTRLEGARTRNSSIVNLLTSLVLKELTVGYDAAYEMSCKDLMKMMTEAYFPRNSEAGKRVVELDCERQADNKRRMENNPRDDHVQQPPYKTHNVERAYTAGPREKRESLAVATNQRAPVAYQRTTVTCYECGEQGHYKSNCPKLKNQNRGNQTGNGEAWGRVYDLGGGEADQDHNNIADNADA
ncbi:reverse transcriptase domain-containing protein [Tanacetum coccineum]